MLEMEASTAEIWHIINIVQWSSDTARMEVAGAPTNHQEEPDMYRCSRCDLTEARHEIARILGADAHTRADLWDTVQDCSKSSKVEY